MNDIIFAAINLGIAVAFFVLGKYVFPKIPKTITDKLFELGQMAEKFVVWAREFMKSSTGAEKMEKVVEMLKEVAEEAGLKVTDEQSMHMTNGGKRWEPLQKRWRNRLPQTSL